MSIVLKNIQMLSKYYNSKKLDTVLYTAGIISISLSITRCMSIIWKYFLKPSPNIRLLYNNNEILTKNNINTWVLITGAITITIITITN